RKIHDARVVVDDASVVGANGDGAVEDVQAPKPLAERVARLALGPLGRREDFEERSSREPRGLRMPRDSTARKAAGTHERTRGDEPDEQGREAERRRRTRSERERMRSRGGSFHL